MTDAQDFDAGTLLPAEYLSWIEIDLEAVRRNYRLLRAAAPLPVRLFAVVKADAYGHGAERISRVLVAEGADMLCVARVEEAIELRKAGILAPMFVFSAPFAPQIEAAIAADCAFSAYTVEQFRTAAEIARTAGRAARIHLKIDIGMARLGIPAADALLFLRTVQEFAPAVRLEGVMTHFPASDAASEEPYDRMTLRQIEMFQSLRLDLSDARVIDPNVVFHAANSAATIDYPSAHFGAVRPGIALYGQYPSAQVRARLPLFPAMSLKSRIVHLKTVPAGTGISYGHTHVTRRAARVATIALGYADGYPRHASNRAAMLVHGQPAPVLGRVCMDHTLIDVTDIPSVVVQDEVLAFGCHDDFLLPPDMVGAAAGTIGYEMTTRIGKRLPRFYL